MILLQPLNESNLKQDILLVLMAWYDLSIVQVENTLCLCLGIMLLRNIYIILKALIIYNMPHNTVSLLALTFTV